MKNLKDLNLNIKISVDDLFYILMATGVLLIISAFIEIFIVGIVFVIMGAFGYIFGKYNEGM